MNPTIEVQITAKLDQLDAGLKVAEAKISKSAVTMGKVGEKAGANFGATFAANLPMMMVATAIAHTIGNGILQAVKDSNAGKSGHDIGLGLAQGIVDGAKSLPVVGVVFGILDEMVNGAEKAAQLIAKKVGGALEKQINSTKAMMDSLKSFQKETDDLIAKNAAGKDPMQISNLQADKEGQADQEKYLANRELEQQRHVDKIAAINAKFDEMENSKEFAVSRTYSDKKRNAAIEGARAQHRQALNKIDDEAARRDAARSNQESAKDKEINEKDAADKKTLEDKNAVNAMEMGNQMVADFRAQKQEEFDVAIKTQQDIIDAEKQAQAQIDKIGRVDQMAGQAAQGMISSGQTALGQFNFAQAGAGGTALEMAKKQVMSLEKIEAATAEQVRLTKENKGFQ
jgi:hypothetical protein